jgi:copper chaperone CopZ
VGVCLAAGEVILPEDADFIKVCRRLAKRDGAPLLFPLLKKFISEFLFLKNGSLLEERALPSLQYNAVHSKYWVASLQWNLLIRCVQSEHRGQHHSRFPDERLQSFRRTTSSDHISREVEMTKTVSFKVGMTCGGCKGAVTRILSKMEGRCLPHITKRFSSRPLGYSSFAIGVSEVKADVDTKLVEVSCDDSVDGQALLGALKNWGEKAGKSVELLEA